MISFFVPGIPKPGGSKRAGAVYRKGPDGKPVPVMVNDRVLVNVRDAGGESTREWRAVVADCGQQAMTTGSFFPFSCPLRVEVVFHFLRPKGHFGTGKNSGQVRSSAPAYPAVKPDATKLWRSTEDALTGICWTDDSLIVEQHISKRYSERAGAEIRISPLSQILAMQLTTLTVGKES